jgi:hypothetical protein
MKRLAIFALVAPLLADAMLLAGAVTGLIHLNFPGFWEFLPVAYVFAMVPALLIGSVDGLLAWTEVRLTWRLITCMVLGYGFAYLPLHTPVLFDSDWRGLLYGFAGLLPAGACCWLSARV